MESMMKEFKYIMRKVFSLPLGLFLVLVGTGLYFFSPEETPPVG